MVATYVEIIAGIKLTNEEACRILLGFSPERYAKEAAELEDVFSNYNISENYQFDFREFWTYNIEIFTSGCCSNSNDVVVGVSLRKIYRLKIRCTDCKKYTLCNRCFNSTEQGVIDYEATYNLTVCPPKSICSYCKSYNSDKSIICTTCNEVFESYDVSFFDEIVKRLLKTNLEAQLYFHWNDCGSCT